MQKQKRSYEEANWAKLSPVFRRTHNRLRQLRGLAPIPEPKVDLWVPPVLRKVEKIDESRQDHEMSRVRPSSARQTGGPLPGFMPADEENWFEDVSMTELERLPTQEWGGLVALWKDWKERVKPAVRQRLLMHMLQLCSDRSDPPPRCLISHIEKEWKKTRVRNRSNTDSMAAVAAHLVRNPKTGSTEMGKLLEIKPTTIEGYFRRLEFWRICAEQARKYDDERALQVLETYIEKFGSTFDYASNETDNVPLSHLVPAMLDSLKDRMPIKSADVAAQRKWYDDFMQPEALKSRLWRASDHPVVPRGARA
jgi:hypothetical protein